jgi:putative transposase
MNFVDDQLAHGRKFRVLTVIDKWHRQCVALQADFAFTGQSVVDAMNSIASSRLISQRNFRLSRPRCLVRK